MAKRSDFALIRAWAAHRSEGDFAEIVRRHGAMVYACCLRFLGDAHAAEDASQATFMILAEKAGSLRIGVNLASWLYGVARRSALMSARTSVRRKRREEEAAMSGVVTEGGGERQGPADPGARLDSALEQLPARERQAVILRYLEGCSQAEAAELAGCPVGTLGYRASRGLERLRTRLAGRGVKLSQAALLAALSAEASVVLPQALLGCLLSISRTAAAGLPGAALGAKAGTSGTSQAALLAKGVTKAMLLTKVKIAMVVICATAAVGVGTPLAYRALAATPGANGGAPKGTGDIKDTALGKFAAAMKPGELKKFPTKGYNRDLMKSWYDWEKNLRGAHKGYSIISWSADAHWDPVSRQIFYFGLGHYASPKFVKYSADTNRWKMLDLPKWADKRKNERKKWIVGHTYDLRGLDPENRVYALIWDGKPWHPMLHFYHIDEKKWSMVPAPNAGRGWIKGRSPMEYFPEMKSFAYVGNGSSLMLYNVKTRKSRNLGNVPLGAHGAMEYNPVHKVLLVGGGDGGKNGQRRIAVVDASGKIKVMKKPSPVYIRCTPDAKLTCDPLTGDYLVQGRGAGMMYAFHPIKEEWKKLSFKDPAPGGMSVQIPECGVVMFCAGWGGTIKLYKHKSPWPKEDAR